MPAPASTTARPDHLDAAPFAAAAPGCPACPHAVAEHDPIGLRYCRATVTSTLDRGCICRTA